MILKEAQIISKSFILYNPLSENKNGLNNANSLCKLINEEYQMIDVTSETLDYKAFFETLNQDDTIYLCGGDGTLNHFVNDTKNIEIHNKVYYYAAGTGNDFIRDVDDVKNIHPILINQYIKKLPKVYVNGKEYLFINGVGYGIDGYCCEIGDKKREEHKENINYTAIAVEGLLFHYKPTNATVIVDGKKYNYKNVWLAPTMFGKYYGGGMIPTPSQSRENDKLSIMVFYNSKKIKTLMIFPKIFKGTHIEYTNNVAILTGKEITVKFDEPRSLQVDGETILNVSEYTANLL